MSTQPPTIAVDVATDTVTISGLLSWTNVRDGVFLARQTTEYRIVLPFAGAPFDPAFQPQLPFGPLPPEAGIQANGVILPGAAAVTIGDPKANAETDAATGLAYGLVSLPPAQTAAGATGHGLLIQSFTRPFQPGRLDGDQGYEIAIIFDETFETATEVVVGMLVRTPIISPGGISDPFISTDLFGEEVYRGANTFAGIDVDGAAPPPAASPGEAPPAAAPQPSPPSMTDAEALAYIASHADLIAAFGPDPSAGARHFSTDGAGEARAITFEPLAYIASHDDLVVAFGADAAAGARHFITDGFAEGRGVTFDVLAYIASHADLRAAFGADDVAGARHFIEHGRAEGRGVTFDPAAYIASHDDLIAAFGVDEAMGALHFINDGAQEGRTVSFDGLEYIASHADLIAALGADADAGERHFIAHGLAEGRVRDAFDAAQYLANHADLQTAFGADEEMATMHFIQFGFAEGRVDDIL